MSTIHTPLTQVDTSPVVPVCTIATDEKVGNEYIYLNGCASTDITLGGSWVTYKDDGTTALLAADAKGPVAVACAVTDGTTKYGWYQVKGLATGKEITATSANTTVGRETTDGIVGDGRAAGDEINNCFCRTANATGATIAGTFQINYPFVNDFTGA